MATVSVIGLGNMGAALARAFVGAGHDVTVWNRDAGRRAVFDGVCAVAATPAEACAASDLVVACVVDYDATAAVLAADGAADALRGRTLVQLASGGPDDARGLAVWAAGHGVAYLDGKILTYPARIGDEPTILAYAGARATYDAHAATLRALGGRSAHVAEAPGGAAAVDLAWLSFLYGATLGLLQGAAFCEAEGVDPSAGFDALPSWLIEIAGEGEYARRLMARGDFHGDQATLDVHLAALHHIVGAAESSGVDAALPRVALDVVSRAVAAGHGGEEIAGAIQVLRRPAAG